MTICAGTDNPLTPGTGLAHSFAIMMCKSILIAEDNDDIRDALAEALENEGYPVHTARNGKEALAKLRNLDTPTLVLLDLMMPVMSGWEFLDAQKGNLSLAPHEIVVMSAIPLNRGIEGDPVHLASASIQKPIDLKVLLSTVSSYC